MTLSRVIITKMAKIEKQLPDILERFLTYHKVIKGHSDATITSYCSDLQQFFRYLKLSKKLVAKDCLFDKISIQDVTLDFVQKVTILDLYGYARYLAYDRRNSAKTRARKVTSIRSFFQFLKKTQQITSNPAEELESPQIPKRLPFFLTLQECIQLLGAVSGKNKVRDYCIITLLLNCGLRVSELAKLDWSNIHGDFIRIYGKGNKERIVCLNEACLAALANYREIRQRIDPLLPEDQNAIFLSIRRRRIANEDVNRIVKKQLAHAGLDTEHYSAHSLRHTAATLMLQNGTSLRVLQQILGHEQLSTTQIYTHVTNNQLKAAIEKHPLAHMTVEIALITQCDMSEERNT